MSDFLEIFTHGRRLQGAVKELSVDELESVAQKLDNIIAKRKEREIELQKREQEKQAKIDAIREQMEAAGLGLDDLQGLEGLKKGKASGQKRPVKYILKDDQGKEHPWTGIGRMPKVYSHALAEGKQLSDFKI
ncbi:H-NS histone family protein [Aestuariibacter halophilus]|uniref:DNA-binding protein n=1 Tax=Fluctibacter halophilus TaxID=226011 RepID=A0ABS8G447_9ALTE|nr:H-NS family nucleoid-associated regulatory protein [Aestuariibacter halophilus]MCC2615374.1 H-NS histone family protein [Aestuariibacter halophilus]